MFGLSTTEIIIILVVVIIIFGGSRLPALGRGLGESIRGFRDAVRGDSDKDKHTAHVAPSEKTDGDSKPT
jgi:sec-independent protein translocase protein TatA